ncbi:hypothetical protein [Pseudomonas sp. PA27(2017)]|uniref:hypothetical protein n=1 Tax=Pseudomonas sp. PA27(2017) TaxID=1932112 RepID=UPI0009630F53|nr:hypothetical protein [Pseudomonas sp. PA27(2017)]OLU30660.1 hypothetical protein BVH06_15645 [Pseudomonas sp. PA27(2017)]
MYEADLFIEHALLVSVAKISQGLLEEKVLSLLEVQAGMRRTRDLGSEEDVQHLQGDSDYTLGANFPLSLARFFNSAKIFLKFAQNTEKKLTEDGRATRLVSCPTVTKEAAF